MGALIEVCFISYLCQLTATGGLAPYGRVEAIIVMVVGYVLLMAGVILLVAKRRRPN
jgi:hypothetical protein